MTRNHGRKTDLARLQKAAGIKRHAAIEVLAIADAGLRLQVTTVLIAQDHLRTAEAALAYLDGDPHHTILCRACGWTLAMLCRTAPAAAATAARAPTRGMRAGAPTATASTTSTKRSIRPLRRGGRRVRGPVRCGRPGGH
ncbi:hypothetical protein ABZ930_26725 [Streptomyces sp. NPDC046716]|uniref:hypothetical protein n=1 Tax=Streptomyces sp. NPDC046716 TaxID=3157093 RepID=UPI0033C5E963